MWAETENGGKGNDSLFNHVVCILKALKRSAGRKQIIIVSHSQFFQKFFIEYLC